MAKNGNRDDFSQATKNRLAKQARYHCSNPSCRHLTYAPTSNGAKEINIGVAAHICAAAPGPGARRYRSDMTPEQRMSPDNGIHLCQDCAKTIDSDDPVFSERVLHGWKRKHAEDMWRSIVEKTPFGPTMPPTVGEIGALLQAAAAADLEVFKRSGKWPQTNVSLMLKVEGQPEPGLASVLGQTLGILDHLVIVAPPGTGKSTVLFQMAEGSVSTKSGTPLVISLSDWSTGGLSLVESILRRPAFRGLTESDLRAVAEQPGVVFMFDSWNELGGDARRRARTEIQALRAELPAATFVLTTRPESSTVPFEGQISTVLELNDQQQIDIARELKGQEGVRLVDQAWRTPGVRELVTIALYLTTLLSLPEGQPFPNTKEEVLRRFVEAHEKQPQHAEPLCAVTHGLQTAFLSDLAVTATRAANTSIPESTARRSVSRTDDVLVSDGQLTIKPQPNDVLDALVKHHLLIKTGEPASYRFQHQQFQEWYASKEVESAMLSATTDTQALQRPKADILNAKPWEEAILFATERMSRGEDSQVKACAVTILAAFDVDPDLAAEMIYRSTDAVWAQVSPEICDRVRRWHRPEKYDRAVRFMITSGRPEFRDLVWPLITHDDQQRSLPALRAARRFRPSVLGPHAAKDILALPSKKRETIVSEIAFRSSMDGLDLAAQIAKSDADPALKAAAVEGMAWRRADHHIADVLSTVNQETFDLLYQKGYLEEIDDKAVQDGLSSARARAEKELSAYKRLRAALYSSDGEDHVAELVELIATVDIKSQQDSQAALIHEASRRYSEAVGQGLLRRLKDGRELFYGADDILAASGIVIEDDTLVEMALAPPKRNDFRAEAAASVLGPASVGKLIDAKLALNAELKALRRYDEGLANRYYGLRELIAHAPGASVLIAVQQRAASANNDAIHELSKLLSRKQEYGARARPFPNNAHAEVAKLAAEWGERLVASGDTATREQFAAIADLIAQFPSVGLLSILHRLLEVELTKYRTLRKEAATEQWQGPAANGARMNHFPSYQRAFAAIRSSETTALMVSYLSDEHFGDTAANVLQSQWADLHEPKLEGAPGHSKEFSRVEDARKARLSSCNASTPVADAIFAAITPLIAEGATELQKQHAVKLAIHGVRLPHGDRSDVIETLLEIAPQQARAVIVRNLILSGGAVPLDVVKVGIKDVFEDAKKYPWILDEGWQLKAWLSLLPFTDHTEKLPEIIADLPERFRGPHFLEEMLRVTEHVESSAIEGALFDLADNDAAFLDSQVWREAIRLRGTLTSARRYLDLVLENKIEMRDGWQSSEHLAELLNRHSELRTYAYSVLKDGETPKLTLLARAIAEGSDPDGLIQLVQLENQRGQRFITLRTIQRAVTEHIPSDPERGAFEMLPVAATELRRKLLALTTDGGQADAAARVLREIDRLRDEFGAPEDEPRHPDLASGKPWPILSPGSDAVSGS